MSLQVLILFLSLVALYYGAEFALDGAEKIGRYFGLSPLTIGLIIVGFGTSLPELFVSQLAAYRGHPEIAMGNIMGSNVANIFLILGVSSLFVPLAINSKDIKGQLFLHLALTVLLASVLSFGKYGVVGGAVLFSFFLLFFYFTYRQMKAHQKQMEKSFSGVPAKIGIADLGKLFIGFILLYFGGEYLVSSGSIIGKNIGISEYVLSAVFVAFGTSFPELVTALMACFKKKDVDLITGNIIGSNIFNVAFVLASLGPYEFQLPHAFVPELISLLLASGIMLVLAYLDISLRRLIGVLFLSTYFGMIFLWVSTPS